MTTLPSATLPAATIAHAATAFNTEKHDIDDHPLHSRVLKALALQTHLAGKNLRFETRAGRVTIHGKVRSFFLKQMAQETLKAVPGVAQIDNRMTVDWEHDAPTLPAASGH